MQGKCGVSQKEVNGYYAYASNLEDQETNKVWVETGVDLRYGEICALSKKENDNKKGDRSKL